MKIPVKFLFLALTLSLTLSLFNCNNIELDTTNVDKVEIPIHASIPLMDGVLTIEYDSIFDSDAMGDDVIVYEGDTAYFKYDTIIDFFDDLSGFLEMDEIDFSNMTSFEECFGINFTTPDFTFPIRESFLVTTPSGNQTIEVDTTIIINPQTSFNLIYGTYGIFVMPQDDKQYELDIADLGQDIDLGLEFDVFRVDILDGTIDIDLSGSELNIIADDYMILNPSFRYQTEDPIPIDRVFSKDLPIPIYKGNPTLPKGISLKAHLEMPKLLDKVTNMPFDKIYNLPTLDTTLSIQLADYCFSSDDGSGIINLNVNTFIVMDSPEDTMIVPLPDTLHFDTQINGFDFEHVVFDFGIDTAAEGSERIDIDAFDELPDDLDIEGFKLSDPRLDLKVRSNLGFTTLFDITTLEFMTENGPDPISENNNDRLNVKVPYDPFDRSIGIEPSEDSLMFNSSNSRLENVDLLNVTGLYVDYTVVVNPDDDASEEGKNNFFYNYPQDQWDEIYDVRLDASIKIPFEFYFESITYEQVSEMSLDIDSAIELRESDSINISVTILANDFPFTCYAQFYFDQLNSNGGLDHLDSLFDEAQLLVPMSSASVWDSVVWTSTIDQDMFDNIEISDSVSMKIVFDMDEDEYFTLLEGGTSQIGYKIKVENSSFVIKQD